MEYVQRYLLAEESALMRLYDDALRPVGSSALRGGAGCVGDLGVSGSDLHNAVCCRCGLLFDL